MLVLLNPAHWYQATAVGYALLLVFALLAGGRGLFRGYLLLLAAVGIVWSQINVLGSQFASAPLADTILVAVELGYIGGWYLLLSRMLRGPYGHSMPEVVRRFLVAFWVVLVGVAGLASWSTVMTGSRLAPEFLNGAGLAAALCCLGLAAQLHEDAPIEGRPVLKMLVIATAVVASCQFLVLGVALLGGSVADTLKSVRAVGTLVAIGLLAQSIYQRPQWSLAIFVSPQGRAYVPRFMAMTVVLVVLVALIPLCRALPPDRQQGVAMLLVSVIGLPVMVLLFSSRLSARARVFLSKSSLAFRYDYRDQWLRLIDTLASPEQRLPLPERAIKAVAQIVSSPGGLLWMRDEHDGQLVCVAAWNTKIGSDARIPADDPVIRFMCERQWILDTAELDRNPAMYEGIARPQWLDQLPDALLLVPLISDKTMIGFVLLQSNSAFRLTFEEIDLLRTSGRQIAAHLAQYVADQRLGEVKQFEAFNRLTAFLMHDLKNLIAQQTLVVRNAARHKGNPAFFEDAIATIDNSVARMSKLLQQLQSGEGSGRRVRVRLGAVLQEASEKCRGREPEPRLAEVDPLLHVNLDRERFVMVLAHLIRNAQEATPVEGSVQVRAHVDNDHVLVEIEDNGCGMDPDFVRNRLFRPFDTTKGSKGMGIGAYQARMFALECGGGLDVRSAVGKGTCITIRLPLAGPPGENE